ncbi:PF10994 family protein [Leptospira licerasiae serovar Varillal str. VAR 010]|uniref:PF10994 family protein n=1 Tax=Leptospira licerasiae str. MMD4847 TaxID=1049971 RepID=A0ABN0H574_9LEPT|nr:PF10994 family protein [Leptospira licerasiae serovar Varillal str. VAR 010]EJZ40957.1 PF10994 family protein [Leptospira licerasiae str. MMD4847]
MSSVRVGQGRPTFFFSWNRNLKVKFFFGPENGVKYVRDSVDVLSYYLETYEACRKAFLSYKKQLKSKFARFDYECLEIPKEGGQLDVYCLGEKKKPAKRLVVMSSGIHGVEGFAGSAFQRRWIEEFLLDDKSAYKLPKNSDFLILHGINAHGFKNFLRVNERNVDLNRNFALKREKLHKKFKNKKYRKIQSFLNPSSEFGNFLFEYIFFIIRFLGVVIRFGAKYVLDAAVNGQYEFPKGIYYGGRKPEPVVRVLRKYFKKVLKPYDRILILDFHTGYGAKNGLSLMHNAENGSRTDKNLNKVFGDFGLLLNEGEEDFYRTSGDFTDFFGKIFTQEKDLYPITIELGTFGNLNVMGAIRGSFLMISENRIRFHGSKSESEADKVREEFKQMFYPSREDWRLAAMDHVFGIVPEAITRFSKL